MIFGTSLGPPLFFRPHSHLPHSIPTVDFLSAQDSDYYAFRAYSNSICTVLSLTAGTTALRQLSPLIRGTLLASRSTGIYYIYVANRLHMHSALIQELTLFSVGS